MSDVVAVGVITALSSIAGAGIGALTTYRISARASETAIKTAAKQAEVELAKVQAENERLRTQHREDERRNRQGTYHDLVAILQRIAATPDTGLRASEANELVQDWHLAAASVFFLGSDQVRQRLRQVTAAITGAATVQSADEWRERIRNAATPLVDAMRADVLDY